MSSHAIVAPSSAKQVMLCRASLQMSRRAPNHESDYADEGTAAHHFASMALEKGWTRTDLKVASADGLSVEIRGKKWRLTADMAQHVADYVDMVREEGVGGTILVEQKVRIGEMLWGPGKMRCAFYAPGGEAEHVEVDHLELCRGTGDAIILKPTSVTVIDLKYGFTPVSVERNPQAMLYGLGALYEYSMAVDIETVTLIIAQPRNGGVSKWTCTVDELKAFAAEFAPIAYAALTGAPELLGFSPSEEACKFCDAAKANICPALKDDVFRTSVADLSDFEEPVTTLPATAQARDPAVFDAVELGRVMSKIGMIEDFCKAVRAEAERRLVKGEPVEGFKLIEGRKGNRKWVDEADAAALLKSFRLKKEEMYDYSLISPTQAQKVLAGSATRWKKAEGLITRAPGKPSVAPVDHPSPAYAVVATVEDFV